MFKLSLGERMKTYYEQAYKLYLLYRMPVIMRLDGRAFHTLTKALHLAKPFDEFFFTAMQIAMKAVCREVQGARFAYLQSDEISILLNPYNKIESQPWFGNEIQKMVSVASGVASVAFSGCMSNAKGIFDCRVFVLPEEEVCNYFIWRQQDAKRNSIAGHAQSLYSHRELQGASQVKMLAMMREKGLYWDALPQYKKWGLCTFRWDSGWYTDEVCPLFTQDRGYVNCHLEGLK